MKVVVVVPTYCRAKFIPNLIRCFCQQDYPSDLLSMIILDDSPNPTETSEALQSSIARTENPSSLSSRIVLHHSPIKLTIGEKRNRLNELALSSGATYIACMDDDDYYFPTRISYSVQQLQAVESKNVWIAGCNQALIYFPVALQKEYDENNEVQLASTDMRFRVFADEILYRSPVIGHSMKIPGHVCNASMIYHVNYILTHKYSDSSRTNEEYDFLNSFKEQQVLHLAAERIFVCIAHGNNTVSKYSMLPNFSATLLQAETMIENKECLRFYRGGKETKRTISEETYRKAYFRQPQQQPLPTTKERTVFHLSMFKGFSNHS